MILVWIIAIPMFAGVAGWIAERRYPNAPRWIALAALAADALLLVPIGILGPVFAMPPFLWWAKFTMPWIPQWGISFAFGVDGLSFLMLALSVFMGVAAVLASWTEIRQRVGFFHFNLLWVLAGITGVFVARDLFLFFFFWEMMLIPMYFLIALWGHENRMYAAVKFFIFTQLSGLLMLVAIVSLYFIHGKISGVYTFDYATIAGTVLPPQTSFWLFLGFFAAFAVKLPVVPVHSWLPDAHTEAPTAGSVILAGLLLKTGAYGLIRFAIPLCPTGAAQATPIVMGLAVVGILYGAVMAFAQRDLKRLVAYSSISHMGFVLLGIFAWNTTALQGAVMQMICHGIGTGALFILVGVMQERMHTRDIRLMGGLWSTAPRMGGVALFFALASLGLPGLGNFVAEFLILMGAYPAHPIATALAAIGLVLGSIYSLWIVLKVFHGPNALQRNIRDLVPRELAIMAALMAALVWLGMYPAPVLRTAEPSVKFVQAIAEQAATDPNITKRGGNAP